MKTPGNHYKSYEKKLAEIAAGNGLRQLQPVSPLPSSYIDFKGKKLLNLCSNDYLGLASDKNRLKAFLAESLSGNNLESSCLGSTGSRLMCGTSLDYIKLEKLIEELYGKPALIFNSGYHANIGILQAVTTKQDLILSDKLNHASLIDGMRLANAEFIRFPHLDYERLETLLKEKRENFQKVFIVSESIFSMDGDAADIARLVELKYKYNAFLYIDEAHAFGVCGNLGLGLSEEAGLLEDIDILVGTFGKAFASIGAFVVANKLLKDLLINTMRPFIYTTALPPIVVSWLLYNFRDIDLFAEKRKHLQILTMNFRKNLEEKGIRVKGNSQIIPIILGQSSKALKMVEYLEFHGFLTVCIRPPTVPEGTSRIRISMTSNMKWQELQMLPDLILQGMRSL